MRTIMRHIVFSKQQEICWYEVMPYRSVGDFEN